MSLDHLPTSIEVEVLNNIRTILKTDQYLVGQAVNLWLGEGDESQDDNPSIDQLPCVRLSVNGYQARRSTEKAHLGKLSLKFECFTEGRAINDQLLLANAIEQSIFSADAKTTMISSQYTNGHVVGAEFVNQGSSPIVTGITRWSTKTTLILDISIKKIT